jgi:hypothetical protein
VLVLQRKLSRGLPERSFGEEGAPALPEGKKDLAEQGGQEVALLAPEGELAALVEAAIRARTRAGRGGLVLPALGLAMVFPSFAARSGAFAVSGVLGVLVLGLGLSCALEWVYASFVLRMLPEDLGTR